MILALLLLLSGLTISAVAIYYSVAGLVAIFSAAVIPIMVMGISLEVGKLVIASWIKARWKQAPFLMKSYAIVAVSILMVITSLGIFGFLSKAHSDQSLVSGDVQAKVAIYDEKIKTAKENIESDRRQLKQMDDAVDQIMGRSSDEKGADKANAVRKSQQRDRASLAQDIESNQKIIAKLNDESAPIRAEVRKVDAEVGPIKYIAAFIYGANPDANILERAVTWVIILIVIVFDPLAVVMLLASQMTFQWVKEDKLAEEKRLRQLAEENTSGEMTKDTQTVKVRDDSVGELPIDEPTIVELDSYVGEKPTAQELAEIAKEDDYGDCPKCNTKMLHATGIGIFCPNKQCDVGDAPLLYIDESVKVTEPTVQYEILEDSEEEFVDVPQEPMYEADDWPLTEEQIEQISESMTDLPTGELTEKSTILSEVAEDIIDRPGDYVTTPVVEEPPRKSVAEAAPAVGRRVMYASTQITADNTMPIGVQSQAGFGAEFPSVPSKGDVFLRVDILPNILYKYNGTKWIEIDKTQTDVYAYEEEYIKYLIEQIDTGKYDPDMLTDVEREQIQEYLKKHAQ